MRKINLPYRTAFRVDEETRQFTKKIRKLKISKGKNTSDIHREALKIGLEEMLYEGEQKEKLPSSR